MRFLFQFGLAIALCFTCTPIQRSWAAGSDAAYAERGRRPTHVEVEPIGASEKLTFEKLEAFCLNADGNLLVCDSGAKQVKIVTPDGELAEVWPLPLPPVRIKVAENGDIYVGGPAVLAHLNSKGRTLDSARARTSEIPKSKASGIAVTPEYVFASFGSGWSLRSRDQVVRLNRDLSDPTIIAKNLRGCCQRLDLAAKDGVLYAAENARYRVLRLDNTGTVLSKWGEKSRRDPAGFGSCCNPMNLAFGPDGMLYTAESGLGRVKRYKTDGTFLGLVGEVGVQRFTRPGRLAASCSNITIDISADGSRVYVQDVKDNVIRVLKKKSPE